MVATHETDSIKVEMEVSLDGLVTITAKVKDAEVFPPINWEDKRARELLVDLAARQMKNLLSQRFQTQGERKGRMALVVCQGCGKPFKIEQPCCGEKEKQVTCPHCGKPQMLRKK